MRPILAIAILVAGSSLAVAQPQAPAATLGHGEAALAKGDVAGALGAADTIAGSVAAVGKDYMFADVWRSADLERRNGEEARHPSNQGRLELLRIFHRQPAPASPSRCVGGSTTSALIQQLRGGNYPDTGGSILSIGSFGSRI